MGSVLGRKERRVRVYVGGFDRARCVLMRLLIPIGAAASCRYHVMYPSKQATHLSPRIKARKNCEKAKVGVKLSHVTHDVANLPQTQIPQKVKQAKASTHAL